MPFQHCNVNFPVAAKQRHQSFISFITFPHFLSSGTIHHGLYWDLFDQWSRSTTPMSLLGTPENPLRVAIVGSGPSGFYAAEHLFKTLGEGVRVDMIERLPTP